MCTGISFFFLVSMCCWIGFLCLIAPFLLVLPNRNERTRYLGLSQSNLTLMSEATPDQTDGVLKRTTSNPNLSTTANTSANCSNMEDSLEGDYCGKVSSSGTRQLNKWINKLLCLS